MPLDPKSEAIVDPLLQERPARLRHV